MASAYSFSDVTIFYSEKELMNNVFLTISEGDRIGVVGRNGAGKSTFLRLLSGKEEPDHGEISVKRGMSVAYLPQTPVLREDDTITRAALDYLPARQGEDPSSAAYEAQTILTQLGFADLNQPVRELSGGQKMRVALAGALCRKSDVLLFDEPTNHIDLDMAQWLEDRLLKYRGTLIVVTHDRYLLERAFSRIFEVGDGKVEIYNTTYSGYLEERAQREEMEAATLRKNKSLYRKELAWIRRGAPARSTKAKGRIQRFDAVAEAIKEAPPEAELTMKSVASRLGKKILSWENLSIGYGENTLVRDFSYTLLRDDRLRRERVDRDDGVRVHVFDDGQVGREHERLDTLAKNHDAAALIDDLRHAQGKLAQRAVHGLRHGLFRWDYFFFVHFDSHSSIRLNVSTPVSKTRSSKLK